MIRLLYKTGSTITDYSKEIESYEDLAAEITSFGTSDAIYIGMRHPFNHLFFKFSTLNDIAGVLDFKIWDGTEFVALAESRDFTTTSGIAFGQDGEFFIVPDRDESGWAMEDTDDITELNTVKIYDNYWMKITTSVAMTNGVGFKFIGNKFCSETELYSEFPEFSRAEMKSAFNTTNWETQIVRASQLMVKDMIAKGIMREEAQILLTENLMTPCVSKTAQIIYAALGDDYRDNVLLAKSDYDQRLGSGVYFIDTNMNADLDIKENRMKTGYLSR